MPEVEHADVSGVTDVMLMDRIKRSGDFEKLRERVLEELGRSGAIAKIEDMAEHEAEMVVEHEGKRVCASFALSLVTAGPFFISG